MINTNSNKKKRTLFNNLLTFTYTAIIPLLIALNCLPYIASSDTSSLEKIKNPLGMVFVKIPEGKFLQGSASDNIHHDTDDAQHEVTITQAFYLQTTEVTQGQWLELLDGNPSAFKDCGKNCPVERVAFEWIELYINKLNTLEPGISYRLPTEAEWEYAARANSTSIFSTGNCLTESQANVNGDRAMPGCKPFKSSTGPMPVASFAPNAWGLFDMHGNVWEICQDWYAQYPTKTTSDPQGPAKAKYKVLRGGSWRFYPLYARSANRLKAFRDIAGFRLVMMKESTTTDKQ